MTLDRSQHFQVAGNTIGGKHFADFLLLVGRPEGVGVDANHTGGFQLDGCKRGFHTFAVFAVVEP